MNFKFLEKIRSGAGDDVIVLCETRHHHGHGCDRPSEPERFAAATSEATSEAIRIDRIQSNPPLPKPCEHPFQGSNKDVATSSPLRNGAAGTSILLPFFARSSGLSTVVSAPCGSNNHSFGFQAIVGTNGLPTLGPVPPLSLLALIPRRFPGTTDAPSPALSCLVPPSS